MLKRTSKSVSLGMPISCLACRACQTFRAEKRSAQASAHPLSQAQGGLFLCVDWVCLLLKLSEMHEVRTFAPCNAFLFEMFAFFSSLENYFGFRTTNVKGKTDHSVSLRWNRHWRVAKRKYNSVVESWK